MDNSNKSYIVEKKYIKQSSMLALIVRSNYGANFTLIGALAGIMWYSILKAKGESFGYLIFAKYGCNVMSGVSFANYCSSSIR